MSSNFKNGYNFSKKKELFEPREKHKGKRVSSKCAGCKQSGVLRRYLKAELQKKKKKKARKVGRSLAKKGAHFM